MAQVTHSGPFKVGERGVEGDILLEKRGTMTQNSTTAVNATLTIPASAIILDAYFDVETVWDSAVSSTGSIGITSGGTEYGGSVNLKTAVRGRPTLTAAIITAMNAPASQNVVFTSTISGATTAGSAKCVVIYKMVT
jgi:hypothetical protein